MRKRRCVLKTFEQIHFLNCIFLLEFTFFFLNSVNKHKLTKFSKILIYFKELAHMDVSALSIRTSGSAAGAGTIVSVITRST